MKIKIDSELSIGQDIWKLNVCGIDYVLYPKPEMIVKGCIESVIVKVTEFEVELKNYIARFGEHKDSFCSVNIGTFYFKSEEDLKNYFEKVREDRYRYHPDKKSNNDKHK